MSELNLSERIAKHMLEESRRPQMSLIEQADVYIAMVKQEAVEAIEEEYRFNHPQKPISREYQGIIKAINQL